MPQIDSVLSLHEEYRMKVGYVFSETQLLLQIFRLKIRDFLESKIAAELIVADKKAWFSSATYSDTSAMCPRSFGDIWKQSLLRSYGNQALNSSQLF